jgi:methionyl-tRNA formyltransferase
MKVESSEVKRLAQRSGLDIIQPENLKDPAFIKTLSSYKADLFCVVAFRILPEEIFAMPPAGCINLHASLLPKYRGAAPINWAIINGETETGLTTFFIRRQVDTGDILMQAKLEIGPEETAGELHDRMANSGADLLLKTIDWIESGAHRTTGQVSALASAAPKITTEIGNIDWTQDPGRINNLVRGLSPKPGAYSFLGGRKFIILRSRPLDNRPAGASPGSVIMADPISGIAVAAGQGALELLEIKPESGKKVTGAEYVRGHKVAIGEKFERKIGK